MNIYQIYSYNNIFDLSERSKSFGSLKSWGLNERGGFRNFNMSKINRGVILLLNNMYVVGNFNLGKILTYIAKYCVDLFQADV